MGASGPGSFDNDEAGDWLETFLAGEDDAPIFAAIDAALAIEPPQGLGQPGGSQVLAAAEVVAAIGGRPGRALPPRLTAWCLNIEAAYDDEVYQQTLDAVERVREHSELAELWAGDADWLAAVADLEARLRRLAG